MADRLRAEIIDHLNEALEEAAEEGADPELVLRRIFAEFGATDALARDYREVVAEFKWRNLRWTVVGGIAVTFAAMRLRPLILEPGWREDLVASAWGKGILFVDRYAFLIAVLVVLGGLLVDRMRHLPGLSAPRLSKATAPRILFMSAMPAVMVLMSALAGIGALLSSTLTKGSFSFLGVEAFGIFALLALCLVLTLNLVTLMRTCRPIMQA